MASRITHPLHWSVFLQTAAFFALTQVIAQIAVSRMAETGVLGYPPSLTLGEFLFGFAIITVVLVALIKKIENQSLIRGVFAFAIFSAVTSLMLVFVPTLLAVVLGLVAVGFTSGKSRLGLQNLAVLAAASGVAFVLGITASWRTLMLVLLVLGLYDMVAVYGTAHMVEMAKKLLARHIAAAIVIPERIRGWWVVADDAAAAPGYLTIGTGDLALPAAFAVAASIQKPAAGIGALVGGLIGLFVLHFIFYSQPNRVPMPALPPIVTGSILGFLVVYLAYV